MFQKMKKMMERSMMNILDLTFSLQIPPESDKKVIPSPRVMTTKISDH